MIFCLQWLGTGMLFFNNSSSSSMEILLLWEMKGWPWIYGVPEMLDSFPFLNICMNLLEESSNGWVQYHYYQLMIYIATPRYRRDAVDILSWCLDTAKVWMGVNGLKLNRSKTELLFVHWFTTNPNGASGWAGATCERIDSPFRNSSGLMGRCMKRRWKLCLEGFCLAELEHQPYMV